LSDKYISQDILEEQIISDKEIISKTEDIPKKETKIDRIVVLKSDNITSNNITKEERILNKDEISQSDNIAKEQTILNNDMILDSNNVKEEAISNKNVALQLKDVSQKENVSDKKIVLEPENIFNKKTVSSKKNITWKEITTKHKEIVIDDEQEFVYDEISYEEKSQQCILDMICLAKNIYLINDIRCWEWFFNRDEYKELYKNDKFRLNFVETIQQIFGWTRKTLLYIQGFLKQYQKVSSRKAETNTIKWKLLKRPKLFDYMKAKQNNVTNPQKKEHDRESVPSGSFLEYIRIYLEYAHNNMGRVEDLYQSGRNSTHVLTYIYAFAIIITILMLYGLVSGRNYKNTEQEKRIEQWDQERLENIEKWNQERLEKLKAEKESIRQLEEQTKEMMSTFTDEIDDIIK